jgi:cytidylate kinase
MIITIDGPAGTGKTTVARRVAECLHFAFFDTGAMYRAVAYHMLKRSIALEDAAALKELLEAFSFQILTEGRETRYVACGEDVTEAIRSAEVTATVSPVSALPAVREAVWRIQRECARGRDAVFEGRDMGSVVFPNADLKVFLTARPEIRAQRRLDELLHKRPDEAAALDADAMLAAIMKRDAADSTRTLAPLVCPEGAYQIDTSDLSLDEVVELILQQKLRLPS